MLDILFFGLFGSNIFLLFFFMSLVTVFTVRWDSFPTMFFLVSALWGAKWWGIFDAFSLIIEYYTWILPGLVGYFAIGALYSVVQWKLFVKIDLASESTKRNFRTEVYDPNYIH